MVIKTLSIPIILKIRIRNSLLNEIKRVNIMGGAPVYIIIKNRRGRFYF